MTRPWDHEPRIPRGMPGGGQWTTGGGGWAERLAKAIVRPGPVGRGGTDHLAEFPAHHSHTGAKSVESEHLVTLPEDHPLFAGNHEVYNHESGQWETLIGAYSDEQGGFPFNGITTVDRHGRIVGFSTSAMPDPEEYDYTGGDEDYDQLVQGYERDHDVQLAIRPRQGPPTAVIPEDQRFLPPHYNPDGEPVAGEPLPPERVDPGVIQPKDFGAKPVGPNDDGFLDWQVAYFIRQRTAKRITAAYLGRDEEKLTQQLRDLQNMDDGRMAQFIAQARDDWATHVEDMRREQPDLTFLDWSADQLAQLLRRFSPSELWPR